EGEQGSNLNLLEQTAQAMIFALQGIDFIAKGKARSLLRDVVFCAILRPALMNKRIDHLRCDLGSLSHAAIVVSDQCHMLHVLRGEICNGKFRTDDATTRGAQLIGKPRRHLQLHSEVDACRYKQFRMRRWLNYFIEVLRLDELFDGSAEPTRRYICRRLD